MLLCRQSQNHDYFTRKVCRVASAAATNMSTPWSLALASLGALGVGLY